MMWTVKSPAMCHGAGARERRVEADRHQVVAARRQGDLPGDIGIEVEWIDLQQRVEAGMSRESVARHADEQVERRPNCTVFEEIARYAASLSLLIGPEGMSIVMRLKRGKSAGGVKCGLKPPMDNRNSRSTTSPSSLAAPYRRSA